MIKEKNISLTRLKQIYRILAKQTHPDMVKDEKKFRILKTYYEEADIFIRQKHKEIRIAHADNQKKFFDSLERLYIFHNCIDNKTRLDQVVEASASYNVELNELFTILRNEVQRNAYASMTKRYEQLIRCIGYYYYMVHDTNRDTIVQFNSYRDDFSSINRQDSKNEVFYECIRDMYDWLRSDLVQRGIIQEN